MKLYVFKSLPPFLWGYTRDFRAMWAMEECGLIYEAIGFDCGPEGLGGETEFGKISMFKQVPVIDDDGFILAESGAILLYLAEKSGHLLPKDLQEKSRVQRWCLTALNNIELMTLPIFFGEVTWHLKALPKFLGPIDEMLQRQAYIAGTEFTVADILMTCVLREIRKTELLKAYPNVERYRLRCESRPAFEKAMTDYEDRLGIPRGAAR